MAKATKVIKQVEKIVKIDEETIILELTKAEAKTLRYLTGDVLGCGKTSPRKYTDSIYYALGERGITQDICSSISSQASFKDNTVSLVEN